MAQQGCFVFTAVDFRDFRDLLDDSAPRKGTPRTRAIHLLDIITKVDQQEQSAAVNPTVPPKTRSLTRVGRNWRSSIESGAQLKQEGSGSPVVLHEVPEVPTSLAGSPKANTGILQQARVSR